MRNQIDISRHPYGLGGGTILSGSITQSVEGFWFYPLTSTTANVKIGNLANSLGSVTYTAGNGVYGTIFEVSQSSGVSIVYSGAPDSSGY